MFVNGWNICFIGNDRPVGNHYLPENPSQILVKVRKRLLIFLDLRAVNFALVF